MTPKFQYRVKSERLSGTSLRQRMETIIKLYLDSGWTLQAVVTEPANYPGEVWIFFSQAFEMPGPVTPEAHG